MSYQILKVNGVIVGEKEIGESDKIFSFFSKELGRIEVLGKGIRKIKAKLKSLLQILNYLSLEIVKGKSFFIAVDGALKNSFPSFKNNLSAFRQSLYLCFLVNHFLKPEVKDNLSFELFLESLKQISQGLEASKVIRYFEWNFLKNLGLGMEVSRCPLCQKELKKAKFFFSPRDGGVVCQECSKKNSGIEISTNALKVLRLILLQKREIYFKIKMEQGLRNELRRISKIYLSYFFERPIFVP